MEDKNFKFKKKFGQNFLCDSNIINKIVNCNQTTKEALVIEIGCGSGNLTKVLCQNFTFVLGYEIDNDVKPQLNKALTQFTNYEIIYDDFLKRNIKTDVEKYHYEEVYVIANLPYYITTPIIEKLISSGVKLSGITIMIQKEVAERFCALPGSRQYSSISVYLNYYFDVRKQFLVSRNVFIPKPNVDSIVLTLTPSQKYCVKDETVLFKLVKDSFRFKRKTLRNNLREYDLNTIQRVLSQYNFDLSVRAEQLSLQIFCDIADELSI